MNLNWQGVTASIFRLNRGEKIPRHQHRYEHTTAVVAGETLVQIFDGRPLLYMTPQSANFALPANIDHEIEAMQDGTIVVHMTVTDYLGMPPPEHVPVQSGVMLHDGTVVIP